MFHYGDVIWVDLDPAAGHEQTKRRPAIVVSNDSYNRFNNLIMVVPVTSAHEYPLHINIGVIEDERGNAIHGWAQVEQLKSLDLRTKNATVVGEVDADVLNALTEMILGCLMQPTMRIEQFA